MISGPSSGIACRPMVEVRPTASPRLSAATSLLTMWKVSGGRPPSARPISARAASSVSSPTARPELIEASEKITVARDQQQLAAAGQVGGAGQPEARQRPGHREDAVDQADLGVVEVEFGLDHRRQQAERACGRGTPRRCSPRAGRRAATGRPEWSGCLTGPSCSPSSHLTDRRVPRPPSPASYCSTQVIKELQSAQCPPSARGAAFDPCLFPGRRCDVTPLFEVELRGLLERACRRRESTG